MGDNGGGAAVMLKGKLVHDTYGHNPRLLPASRMASFRRGLPCRALTYRTKWTGLQCCEKTPALV